MKSEIIETQLCCPSWRHYSKRSHSYCCCCCCWWWWRWRSHHFINRSWECRYSRVCCTLRPNGDTTSFPKARVSYWLIFWIILSWLR